MPLISGADSPTFNLGATTFYALAAPSRGATENAVWRISVAPGVPGALHQLTREEIFVCISGLGAAQIGDQTHQFAVGDALIVPPNTNFSLAALGDTPLEAIVVFPVGGKATLPGGTPFTPPWAE